MDGRGTSCVQWSAEGAAEFWAVSGAGALAEL